MLAKNGIPLLKNWFKRRKVAWKTTTATSKAVTKPLLVKEIDTAQETD